MARRGGARCGKAKHTAPWKLGAEVWRGKARQGRARQGPASPGDARHGKATHIAPWKLVAKVWPGEAGRGLVRQVGARLNTLPLGNWGQKFGEAGHGQARPGTARHGQARLHHPGPGDRTRESFMQKENTNETSEQEQTPARLPLWRHALDRMRAGGYSYGSHWKTEFFEQIFRCQRESNQFRFEMMALKQAIEEEDGYYLRSSENGDLWNIPLAFGHEETARSFDQKLRRYAVRSINLRSATLMNPKAELTDSERRKMEHNLEKASVRLLLISRQQSVVNSLKDHSPKLLAKK